jgi:uncharacterized LabA/DUF88 family protein
MNINQAAHPEQRVAVFIDTQNLYHSAKSNFHANVNYEELMKVAVNGRRLVRAFAYVIKSEEGSEEKFFDALLDIGIETRVKDLQIFHTGAKKADWDVGIAVDMIRLTEKVDTVVLCSGDGDFLEVVRYCQSRGVRVEIMAFEKTTNARIMEEVDHFTDLGARDSKFLIGSRRRTTPRTSGRPSYFQGNPSGQSSSVTPPQNTLKVSDMSGNYGNNSSLSAQNRMADNSKHSVPPSIFGRNKSGGRRVKPVVGLPAKPNPPLLGGQTLINDETKHPGAHPPHTGSLDNAFGNDPGKKPFN